MNEPLLIPRFREYKIAPVLGVSTKILGVSTKEFLKMGHCSKANTFEKFYHKDKTL